jgi:hypothetical protein
LTRNYHTDYEYLNHSILRTSAKSLARYHGIITGEIPPTKSTPDMITGQIVHQLVLEPDKLDENFLVADLNSRRGKNWEAVVYDAEQEGLTPVLRKQVIEAAAMRDALEASEVGRFYFSDEHSGVERIHETAVYCEIDGVKRKAKPDVALIGNGTAILADLKTTVDPTKYAFGNSAAKFGYHTQAAYYTDVFSVAHNILAESIRFVIIAIDKEEPYDIYPMRVTPDQIEAGRRINNERIARIKECRESGVWLAPEQQVTTDLWMPSYATKGEDE